MKTPGQKRREAVVKHATAVAQLACADLPTNYVDYNHRIWLAFEHGREYQRSINTIEEANKKV